MAYLSVSIREPKCAIEFKLINWWFACAHYDALCATYVSSMHARNPFSVQITNLYILYVPNTACARLGAAEMIQNKSNVGKSIEQPTRMTMYNRIHYVYGARAIRDRMKNRIDSKWSSRRYLCVCVCKLYVVCTPIRTGLILASVHFLLLSSRANSLIIVVMPTFFFARIYLHRLNCNKRIRATGILVLVHTHNCHGFYETIHWLWKVIMSWIQRY